MLTNSDVLNRVKARLGTSAHRLELDEEDIAQCIRQETLPTLSVFFPREEAVIINQDKDAVPDDPDIGTYYLRAPSGLTVLGVIEMVGLDFGSRYATRFHHMRRAVSFQDVVSEKLVNMSEGLAPPYVAEFIPPDKFRVTPNPPLNEPFVVKVKTVHKDFSLFPFGLRETILTLAECDVRMDLLGVRQHFTNVSAEFAEIELNLGPFEDARTKRDELLEKMAAKQHLSASRKKVWIA